MEMRDTAAVFRQDAEAQRYCLLQGLRWIISAYALLVRSTLKFGFVPITTSSDFSNVSSVFSDVISEPTLCSKIVRPSVKRKRPLRR